MEHESVAHCPGWGDGPEDWLEECHDCQRRAAPPSPDGPVQVGFALCDGDSSLPPQIVTLWCDSFVPQDLPEDQRLRELAAEIEAQP